MDDIAPDLLVDAYIYPTSVSGRVRPVPNGYPCPCRPDRDVPVFADCRFLLDGKPLQPGERRRVELAVLGGKSYADWLRGFGKFYFWELGIFGEAIVVSEAKSDG